MGRWHSCQSQCHALPVDSTRPGNDSAREDRDSLECLCQPESTRTTYLDTWKLSEFFFKYQVQDGGLRLAKCSSLHPSAPSPVKKKKMKGDTLLVLYITMPNGGAVQRGPGKVGK